MTEPTNAAGTAPTIVAAIRGLIIAVVLAALGALATALAGVDLSSIDEGYRPLVALVILIAARTVEGLVDQLRGQAPQAGPLGGAPANPVDYLATAPSHTLEPLPYAAEQLVHGTQLNAAELEAIAVHAVRRARRVERATGSRTTRVLR